MNTEEDTIRRLKTIPYEEMIFKFLDNYCDTPDFDSYLNKFLIENGWTREEYNKHFEEKGSIF